MNADLHIAEMLHDYLEDGAYLMLSKGRDGLYDANAGQRSCTAMTLEDCLEGLAPHARTKVCIREGCAAHGKPQNLAAFGPDGDARDGHASVCRACENVRVSAHNKKKKSIAAVAPAGHQDQVSESLGKVE
jgi:hypothetical protein